MPEETTSVSTTSTTAAVETAIVPIEAALVDPVDANQPGFKERVTPKEADKVNFFRCPCGSPHFRHAGYMKTLLPFLKPGGEKRVCIEQFQVQVCVKCRKAFVWIDEQMYDVTKDIDLNAWEKAEKELHKATGPGGEC